MSKKSSVSSSNTNRESRKWRTEFKEINSPRSLPTYYGDEELQQHHTPPLSSSLGDDNPLKELQPLKGRTSSVESGRSGGSSEMEGAPSLPLVEELRDRVPSHPLLEGHSESDVEVDVSTLPLDIDNPSMHKLLPDVDGAVPSKESIERSLNPGNPDVVVESCAGKADDEPADDTSVTVKESPKDVPISSTEFLEANTEISPISSDLSLGKIEGKEDEVDIMDNEDSLDLFQDVRKKNPRPTPPPRPPKPKVAVTEPHPLMQIIDPDPDLNFGETFRPESPKTGFTAKISRNFRKRSRSPRPEETENNSPTPPVNKTETGSQDSTSVIAAETTSITSSESTPSRKQKFKAMRSHLAAKASQYYDYYYNKNKQNKEELEEAAAHTRTSSENSEASFCEITVDDVAEVPKAVSPDSDAEQSATEFVEDEAQVVTANCTPNNEPVTATPAQSPSPPTPPQPDPPLPTTQPVQKSTLEKLLLLRHQLNLSYQKHLLYSSLVCLFSVFLYIIVYYCNSFLQGFFLGGFLPTLLGVLFLVFTRTRPDIDEESGARTAQQVERLRKLGNASSLKDFFQYTEAHNFGELRTKNLPYRYFKLKGSIIEAFELSAAKDEVPDPLKLTPAEIRAYGLKPIFKADISGWLVTIEAPPGSTITPSNMWRKRYPIWVRKRSWRTDVDEYDSEYTVNSFYLISPYSRYKEHWYEALRRAVLSSDMEDEGNLEIGTYRDFMERLFDEIPSLQDEEKKVEEDENVQNVTSVETEAPSPVPKVHDMQHSAWINALFGRFVWNILHDKKWENRIQERIVKKLSSVNNRHVSSLELKSFDLGNSVPLITNTYLPKIDHQGVWSEMDLEWSGEVSLTLAARVNSKSSAQGDNSKTFEVKWMDGNIVKRSGPMKLESERGTEQASSGKLAKLYKLIEKIEIGVCAKVTRVAGRLCVNIPPPPTDCIWYGFTEPPELKIHLNPILGRWISLDYKPITNALEKQLQYLFHDTFVLPAMENIVMPGMSRNLEMRTENTVPETLDVNQLLGQPTPDSELLDVATPSGGGSSRAGNSPSSMRNSPVL